MTRPTGLYIHIPFCHHICPFCSFNVIQNRSAKHEEFLRSLKEEIRLFIANCEPMSPITSIYFGGGTPSALSGKDLSNLLTFLRSLFPIDQECCVSIEINPEDASAEFFCELREAGFNRVSLGVQSFQASDLTLLGRKHSPEDSFRAINNCKEAGFSDINLDFMYGLPFQSVESVAHQAEIFSALKPQHISAYALTIEQGTPFFKKKNYSEWINLNDSIIAESFYAIHSIFENAGLSLYEVSNFSVPKFRSPQNLVYWNNGDYFGFGPGAHSKIGNSRSTNATNLKEWQNFLQQGLLPVSYRESLTPRNWLDETLMIRLRTAEGICLSALESNFGIHPSFLSSLTFCKNLAEQGQAIITANSIRLTKQGLMFADKIAVDFSALMSNLEISDATLT